jgi:hypothetical protein
MVMHDVNLALRRYADRALLLFGDGRTVRAGAEGARRADAVAPLRPPAAPQSMPADSDWFIPESEWHD